VRSHSVTKRKNSSMSKQAKLRASNHVIKRSKRGTSVDRGANGSMLGDNAKVAFHRNKSVDVAGIDNCELTVHD